MSNTITASIGISTDAKVIEKLTVQKLLNRLSAMYQTSSENKEKVSVGYKSYESVYAGKQWEVMNTGLPRYSPDGKELWMTGLDNAPMADGRPQRTVNKITPLIQTESSMFKSIAPRFRVKPKSISASTQKSYYEDSRLMNIFFDNIFNEDFSATSVRNFIDIAVYGANPLATYFNSSKAKENKIPFEIKKESSYDIHGDPHVQCWREVKYAFRVYKKYRFEAEELFDFNVDLENMSEEAKENTDYNLVELMDCYILGEALGLQDSPDVWYKFTVDFKTMALLQPLFTDKKRLYVEYPVLPIDYIRMYLPEGLGWHGVSEIHNIWELQKIINKRASQEDFSITYGVDPAIEIDAETKADLKQKNPYLFPSKIFTKSSKRPNVPSVQPITWQQVPLATFVTSKKEAEADMNSITGIEATAQGRRTEGMYSGALFKEVNSAVMSRFDLKIGNIKEGYLSMARKIIAWAIKDLTLSGKYYEMYDPDNDATVKLNLAFFENMKKFNIEMEVVEAELLSKPERLQKVIEMRQYNPEFPPEQIVLMAENIYPGLFRRDYIELIEFANANKMAATRAQIEQANNPPAPPAPGNLQPAPASMPPASPEAPAESAELPPEILAQMAQETEAPQSALAQITAQMIINMTDEQGIPEEEAVTEVENLINAVRQQYPGITDDEIAAELMAQSQQA